ncbi:MAG: zinc ribbon domain-containing protein [Myxococcota bacterium]
MIGITSYGAYVPPTRLPFAVIAGRRAVDGAPEKAVAWNDEDAVTMAVEAAVNCLRGFDRNGVDAVLFASTTYAFREKQAAALVAKALDLPRVVETSDLSGSLRAGTTALRSASAAVAAGTARNVLVIASDCRMAAPNSSLERNFGDGAAAFLVGDAEPIATFGASHTVADEIVDVWRSEGDRFVHSWEDRYVVQEGYTPNLIDAVGGLLDKLDASASEFARFVYVAPDARSHGAAGRRLRIDPECIQPPLFGALGNAGVAFAPLLLAAALETARAGDHLLVANYGDGADAMALEITGQLEKLPERRAVSWHLARRRSIGSYGHYLEARGLESTEWRPPHGPGLSATAHHRDRDEDIALRGQRCHSCDAIQFPAQRVCETCFRKDDFEPVRLSDRVGKVVTYTFDYFFPTPDPPTVVTVTDVDGARMHLQLVDCLPDETRIGLPVEFTFRRIHESGGRPNYYWKVRPLPD